MNLHLINDSKKLDVHRPPNHLPLNNHKFCYLIESSI